MTHCINLAINVKKDVFLYNAGFVFYYTIFKAMVLSKI